ncbi:MAG TPA: hypothetical protein VJB56_02020 [Candidatus Paceibacterota bacterium]
MFDWVWAYFAARRLGLRDRGKIQKTYLAFHGDWTEWKILVCKNCNTRIRIGLTKTSEVVRWCWRCEVIIAGDGGPDGGEQVEELSGADKPNIRDEHVLRAIQGGKRAHG